jgi:ankyrin repeat protein
MLRGAHKNATDADHFTPLLVATATGKTKTIEQLLKLGAAVDIVDKDDRSVVYWAAVKGNADALAALLRHPLCRLMVNRCDREEEAPLHAAAAAGNAEVVEMLIQARCRVDVKDGNEATPLHLASKAGYTK